MELPNEQLWDMAKWLGVPLLALIALRMTVLRFNRLRELYNEVHALDADINTALGQRRDLLLRARIIAKDYQDHELRMKAIRPDASIVIQQPTMAAGVPPPLPIMATSNNGTKADESQSKVQQDINYVEGYLRTKIERQHQAVKDYRNYRDRFPNILFAKVIGVGEVEFFRYKEDESFYKVEDINAQDRDIHRSIFGMALPAPENRRLPAERDVSDEPIGTGR